MTRNPRNTSNTTIAALPAFDKPVWPTSMVLVRISCKRHGTNGFEVPAEIGQSRPGGAGRPFARNLCQNHFDAQVWPTCQGLSMSASADSATGDWRKSSLLGVM